MRSCGEASLPSIINTKCEIRSSEFEMSGLRRNYKVAKK